MFPLNPTKYEETSTVFLSKLFCSLFIELFSLLLYIDTIIPIIKEIILSTVLLETFPTKSLPSIVILTLFIIDNVLTAGKNPSINAIL